MLLRMFQRQVLLQCGFILRAAGEVNQSLNGTDSKHTFYALQNLLNAAANVSKALWGQGGKLSEQRKPLRDSIGVTDESPLRNVTMRNNFEHFDDRLDRWWKDSKRHNHVSMVIGERDAVAGFEEIDTFRWFNPVTTDMYFWGDSFNIQAIVDEVQNLFPKLEEEANKPHWK
jgi:hypothetical protein